MKKMMLLMLTLFFLGAASMNAQVTIGSNESPHPGAVLDLKSTSMGVILPNVTLSNNAINFQLSGNEETATGMVVYNNGETPGLYVWDGTSWNSLKACTVPAAPFSISFSPAITGTLTPNRILTITVPAVVSATYYSWTLPDSLQAIGVTDGRSIQARILKTSGTIDASGISVKAINDCGAGMAINATGTITVQPAQPVQPTFSISRFTMDPNSSVTLTCQDVGAEYYDWTFPAGFTGITSTTTNSITLTGVTEGKYQQALFKVAARNSLGTSATRTASGDTIFVGVCSTPPVIDTITCGNSAPRLIGFEFPVTADVTTEGTTTYHWQIPKGLTAVNGINERSIQVRAEKLGTYTGEMFTCTASNSCGSTTTATGSANFVLNIVDNIGKPGEDLNVGPNVYKTWVLPNNMGRWMIDYSKEGTPSYMGLPGHETACPWGYYKLTDLADACPAGWHVATYDDDALGVRLANGDASHQLASSLFWRPLMGYVNASGSAITGYGYFAVKNYEYNPNTAIVDPNNIGYYALRINPTSFALGGVAWSPNDAIAVKCVENR